MSFSRTPPDAIAHCVQIGEILSAVKRVAGEAWPPGVEGVANDDIDQEFAIGLFNRQGVTRRMLTDGGGLERDEAAKYRTDAKASALLWPLTRTVLE
jgi:hypothetical protein